MALCTVSLMAGPASAPRGKVILIHGIVNHRSMSTLNRQFKRDGWDVINWKYPSTKKTIDEHGRDLAEAIRNISTDNETPIHYVAFSLGGLVLRAALSASNLPPAAKEGKVILISSPINGSKLARSIDLVPLANRILGNHAGRELQKTSPGDFSERSFPENMPILVLSGTFGLNPVFREANDGKVSVSESCPKAPHTHKYVLAGHAWICRNPMVFDACVDFIENGSAKNLCVDKKKYI
jgi:pimeloyl-ACP methyl ester carboxylesterase